MPANYSSSSSEMFKSTESSSAYMGIKETQRRSPSPHNSSSYRSRSPEKSSNNNNNNKEEKKKVLTKDEQKKVLIDLMDETVKQLQDAQATELINNTSGIAVDNRGVSQGFLSITVVSAKNLPPMKKVAKSSDPYVEVILPSNCIERGVLNIQRTRTCWDDLFPKWNEIIIFRQLLSIQNSNQITFNIRDAVKRTVGEDLIIGTATLPFSLLADQRKHSFDLSLTMPPKRAVSLPIMIDGSIKVDVKLFYSRTLLLKQKLSQLQLSLVELNN
jgi:hypothetical protein